MNTDQNSTEIRKIRRSRQDRMISGVCGGAAKHFGIDPVILRLIFLGLAVFGIGTGILLYLAAWIVIPEE
ncbi:MULTISPECIES: PspC domain-containing protein [Sciscionella]|uniref:PspC domain-containing protein n=1 Tax=Sciscionella TaxID=596495 RepID=UPI00037C40F1|nr:MULTISPECIES: PspC domain-containing protein [Sciscionella]